VHSAILAQRNRLASALTRLQQTASELILSAIPHSVRNHAALPMVCLPTGTIARAKETPSLEYDPFQTGKFMDKFDGRSFASAEVPAGSAETVKTLQI
jgi:hypothetical protein